MSTASATRALSSTAFFTLLLIALVMGANHVAARLAFNNGVDVATAVVFRSAVSATVLAIIIRLQGVPFRFDALTPRQRRFVPLIGLLIGFQSLTIYSSVARLPVALALLAFNSYPIWAAIWARVLYREPVARQLLVAMPVLLFGLTLALDVFGAASGLGASAHWGRIGAGVAFALTAGSTFGLAMVVTQHEAGAVDGRVRTLTTLAITGALALVLVLLQGGPQLPKAASGWWGLAALTFLYGTAFTIMFTVLPRLGVVGNSAIMNVEPVFALVLAWAILGQTIASVQVVGAVIVVATVVMLGMRKK